MKKAKYITGAVLLFVVLVLAGEVYVWHASSFSYSGYTSFSMYQQEGDTHESMLAGIESAARETGVEVFCVDMIIDSLFSMRVNVYATPGVRDALAEKSQIREGTFESPLVGRIQVEIFPFAETPDISKLSFSNEFYIIGPEENIMDFRRATIDDYAGNFPHDFPDGHDSKKIFVTVPWVIVIILMSLLTQFEIELLKKEVVVRLITGESVGGIILKNIAADTIFFAALTAALLAVLRGFTNALYAVDVTLWATGLYLIVNSLSFLRLFFVDFRRDISTKAGAKKTIRAAYVFKIITAVLAVAVLSVNIELAVGAVNFYRQREFFEKRDGYSHLVIPVYVPMDGFSTESEGVAARLYALTLERGTSEMLAWIDGYQYDGGYVFANKGAAEYLKTEIPELRGLITEEKVYFIVPEKLSRRDDVLDDMKQSWELYYREEYKDEILTYKGNPNIVAVTQGNKVSSTLVNPPLIVLNNMGADGVSGYRGIGYLYQATMFKLTPEELDAYQNGARLSGRSPAYDKRVRELSLSMAV
jgi:hypothetical protein